MNELENVTTVEGIPAYASLNERQIVLLWTDSAHAYAQLLEHQDSLPGAVFLLRKLGYPVELTSHVLQHSINRDFNVEFIKEVYKTADKLAAMGEE